MSQRRTSRIPVFTRDTRDERGLVYIGIRMIEAHRLPVEKSAQFRLFAVDLGTARMQEPKIML